MLPCIWSEIINFSWSFFEQCYNEFYWTDLYPWCFLIFLAERTFSNRNPSYWWLFIFFWFKNKLWWCPIMRLLSVFLAVLSKTSILGDLLWLPFLFTYFELFYFDFSSFFLRKYGFLHLLHPELLFLRFFYSFCPTFRGSNFLLSSLPCKFFYFKWSSLWSNGMNFEHLLTAYFSLKAWRTEWTDDKCSGCIIKA